MARSTWTTQKKVSGSWTADGTISRPNDNLSLTLVTTQAKIKLADGSNGFMTPATKSTKEILDLIWYMDDGTVKTKIEAYINNHSYVKIIDHNAAEYIGRFVNIEATWIVGVSSDEYDITARFERME